MTSVVLVDTGGTVVEYTYEEVQDRDEAEDYPAVIVEEVPGASLLEEQGYSAQVLVYDNEVYLVQEVGDEQELETVGEISSYLHEVCFACWSRVFSSDLVF
uniref:Transcription factor Elf N-terminal domain-containing protein n=1 Tax=Monopterus albus TaxID=43700 RepID=A0A3Q3KPS4_MONAL